VSEAPQWDIDGIDWPNRTLSRFVEAGALRWHVQRGGRGPTILLVHGTGSAVHSWRGLIPLLLDRFDVIAIDLPGHGFTQAPPEALVREQLSPCGMARLVSALLGQLDAKPVLAMGNSAGAMVLVRMAIDQGFTPKTIIGLNAALLPFDGIAGAIFLPLARLFASTSVTASLLAWRASDRAAVEHLIRGTGTIPDALGVTLYQRLLRRTGHVGATLSMMANWEFDSIERDLRKLAVPLVLMVGMKDMAVPPAQAQRVCAMVPHAQVVELSGLGHLAQEEAPERVAQEIIRVAIAAHVLPGGLQNDPVAA
jgi:magnesium chelatase accessory protein